MRTKAHGDALLSPPRRPVPKVRSCNRHVDCKAANDRWLRDHGTTKRWKIPVNFHCHDDCCEECFGN